MMTSLLVALGTVYLPNNARIVQHILEYYESEVWHTSKDY